MSRNILLAAIFLGLFAVLSGCIVPETKEYRFKLNPDGSGSGTVTFVNLVSQDDDERDVSFKDFSELVTDFLQGTDFEDQNPAYHVTNKRLFEKDGKLMGEVAFTFSSLDSVGFFRQPNCDCCPTLLYAEAFQENYVGSDGKFLGDTTSSPFGNGSATPFIVWPAGAREFYVKTSVLENLDNTHSLLAYWQDWKKKNKPSDD